MAIVTTRLDGQNIGIQLSAPETFIDAIDLDMATGAITSSYLTADDIRNLKPGVDEIFSIVPFASRAAGALNILTKLVSSASVDASTVIASAVNIVGDIYALRLTPSIPTSNFVLGLPYSSTGGMAFAMSGSVAGGGGGGAVNNVTASLPITSSGGANPNIALNPISNVNVAVGAAIDRSKLAAGLPGQALVNDNLGVMSGVSPGAVGNILTSTGLAWTSSAPAIPAGVVTSVSGAAPIASSGGTTPTISLSPIADANVAVGAAINRGKLANGLPNAVVVNTGAGVMSDVLPAAPNQYLFWNGANWTTAAAGGGLTNWVEAQTAFGGKTIDSFTALAAGPDADAVLAAKGDGATLAQIPDGLTAGGNVRGFYATDWQKSRSNANRVASGDYSTVSGGDSNRANAPYSTVSGGAGNRIDNAAPSDYSFIGGGNGNVAAGYTSSVVGGLSNGANGFISFIGSGQVNTAAGDYAIIVGGSNNLTSFGGFAQYNFIGGGSSNRTGSNYSVVVGGNNNRATGVGAIVGAGINNVASAQNAVVVGGGANTASGNGSAILAGDSNTVTGPFSSILGGVVHTNSGDCSAILAGTSATTRGSSSRVALGSGSSFNTVMTLGSHQASTQIQRGETLGVGPFNLNAEGTAVPNSSANIFTLSDNSAFKIRAEVVARDLAAAGAVGVQGWTIEALAYRDVGAPTTGITAVVTTAFGAGLPGAAVTLLADVVSGGIYVQATGVALKTIHWTAAIYAAETTW